MFAIARGRGVGALPPGILDAIPEALRPYPGGREVIEPEG